MGTINVCVASGLVVFGGKLRVLNGLGAEIYIYISVYMGVCVCVEGSSGCCLDLNFGFVSGRMMGRIG